MSQTATIIAALLACLPGEPGAVVALASDPPREQTRSAPIGADLSTNQETSETIQTVPHELVKPVPAGAQFRRHVVTFGTGHVSGATTGSTAGSTLIYSNTLGSLFIGTSIGGVRFADDISTTGAQDCILDRLITHVTGDRLSDGSTLAEPFSVTVGLYPTCPGADAAPTLLSGTRADGTMVDAETTVSFPDGGMYEAVIEFPGVDIELPTNFYLAVTFDRGNAGLRAGGLPTLGHSADGIDFPGIECNANFGIFPRFSHASFDAEVFVRGPCAGQFAGYHASKQSGNAFTAGPGQLFADELTLDVGDCRMVAYEVRMKGKCQNCSGAVEIDLKQALDPIDPAAGERIPGTRKQAFVFGDKVQRAHFDFDPPIPLDSRKIFVAFRTTTGRVGPILAGRPTLLSQTDGVYMEYQGAPPTGVWVPLLFPVFSGAFDVTVFCEGSPPVGACCDMIFTDGKTCVDGPNEGSTCATNGDCRVCVGGSEDGNPCAFGRNLCPGGVCADRAECVGDSVCRDVARRNCSTAFEVESSQLWSPGNVCADVCVGGINDGAACTRQADCPGGDCPGPLQHACGVSACCKPDDTCENLTFRDCLAVPPVENLRQWQSGPFCGESDQACPFNACVQRVGRCTVEHSGMGCGDPSCCSDVCEFDSWCCLVEWDKLCVRWSQEFDGCTRTPSNDDCFSVRADEGAAPLEMNSTLVFGDRSAGVGFSDPEYCCENSESGIFVRRSVWFSFVATETSARLSTCASDPTLEDTMINVFRAVDPTTLETACNSLDAIGCNDNAATCSNGLLSDVCVTGLTPGDSYFVAVAGKQPFQGGVLRLTLEAPCEPDEQFVPGDDCRTATTVLEGRTPFDVAGATFDCPGPNCLSTLRNDIWFDWTATITGNVQIDTCGAHPAGRDCDLDPGPCDAATPDTSMVIYEGCGCPVDSSSEIACSDFQPSPCFLGSLVRFSVVKDMCYKIRVGGLNGAEPSGDLSLRLDACTPGDIEFIDPPTNTIDARQPHAVDDAAILQGIDRFVVRAAPNAAGLLCWSLCEKNNGGSPNRISSVVPSADGTKIVITLDRPITPGAVTTLSYRDSTGAISAIGRFTAHPGNIDGILASDSQDIEKMLELLAGVGVPRWGIYSVDIDHSGAMAPTDLLRLIDVLNGGDEFAPGWNATAIPGALPGCP